MNSEKIIKIVRPERIARIIERVCHAKLDVLIRVPGQSKVAVRAKAHSQNIHGNPPTLRLTGLSAEGVRFLWNIDVVQVDFVGMSTQMIFKTKLITVDGSSVHLLFPKTLVSYDRRQNARYATTTQLTAFMNVSLWKPRANDITAPPIIYPYDDMGSWVALADISEGGFCGVTRFPALLETYTRGVVDEDATLIFPMQAPVAAPVEIRWTRRIREAVNVGSNTFNQRVYKFGAQFTQQNEDLARSLKQFVHQISMSDAI